MREQDLRAEYERIYLGMKKNYSSAIFAGGNRETNQKHALTIIKYSFEHFLHWQPEDIKRYVNWKTLEIMKLDTLIKYIEFPGELNPKNDLFYLAHLIYPNQIKYSTYDMIIGIYKKVIEKKLYRFPKDFWDDEKGIDRAKICFRYMVRNYLAFHDIDEMYQFFASDKGRKSLKQYQLLMPCELFYDHPLDYLQDAMPDVQKDEFIYHYLRFQVAFASKEKELSEKEKNTP